MNHKFKIKQRVAALCMAAMMCCSLFPAGAFAEAPRADADGTFRTKRPSQMTAIRPRQATRTRVKKARLKAAKLP